MKLALFAYSILAVASLNAATITVGTQALGNFSSVFPVISTSGLLPDGSGYVAIGATTLSDIQVGEISTPAGLAAFQADFSQFGTSASFGGPGVFNEPSLFSFTAAGSTIIGDDFVGNAVILVAGNGADLNSSTELFVYQFNINYAADDPAFSADVDLSQAGTILFGTTAADVVLPNAGTHDGFQMALVGIPEPSTLLLSAFGVLGLLRRKR